MEDQIPMTLEQISGHVSQQPKRFEFSAYVTMQGIHHARFITDSGEPILLTRDQCVSRAASCGCDAAVLAMVRWPFASR